ncbi:MAG: HAD family hydrolase [Myxococcota bacterium]
MYGPPRVLLFDVMDTLVKDPFYEEMPAFFGCTLDELLAAKSPTAWVEFELGYIDEHEYHRRAFRDGRNYDGAALFQHMYRAYAWLEGAEALLAELQARGTTMHAFSNYPVWYRALDEKLGLGDYLSWTFVSCLTGIRKPAPEAYLGAARHLGLSPAELLFIDDREGNCRAASELGMATHHFRSVEQLRAYLGRVGVLPGG